MIESESVEGAESIIKRRLESLKRKYETDLQQLDKEVKTLEIVKFL